MSNSIEVLKKLQQTRSTGTTLISYYIPGGGDLSHVSQHIARELSSSQNIKSKTTRKDVQSALRSMQQHLKGIKKVPSNGLAIFSCDESYV